MRVLVTGGAGFVGTVLVDTLLRRGFTVRVVDNGFFTVDHVNPEAELVLGDIMRFEESWLDGVDAVIHLAGISNDPMADFSPKINFTVNAAGTAIVAHAVKKAGISRFVFASTCSVYGFNDSAELDEESLVGPSFPYAISKLMGERAIQCLTDDSFRPIILRKGTVIGWSPKMRYDLAANTMVKTAYTQGKITVNNPSLWRPFIDVKDVAMAYVRALDADPALSGVFNIAYDNFTIGRLADDVAAALRDFEIHVPVETFRRHDLRSYRVSTRKAREILDFHAEVSIKQSVAEVVEHVLSGENSDFDNPIYTNVQWMTMKLAEGVPLG